MPEKMRPNHEFTAIENGSYSSNHLSRTTYSTWRLSVGCLILTCWSSTLAFVQPPRHTFTTRSCCSLYSSTINQQHTTLEKMTVKELRQLLIDQNLMKRGLSSKLKRKQDLIDYLKQNLPTETTERKNSVKQPLGMPPLQDPIVGINGESSINNDDKTNATMSPKDLIFEKVYQRYPPLQDENFTALGDGDLDVRQMHHPIMQNSTEADFELITIGTASCAPGITRGVSCTALRLRWRRGHQERHLTSLPASLQQSLLPKTQPIGGGLWFFDAGECTQLQLQKSPYIKPSKISKIFLTHAHGDHTFGLPGLLCTIGQDWDRSGAPIDIYGPEGLRMWLRVAIRYSASRIVPRYRVHELVDVPIAPEWVRNTRTGKYFNGIFASNRRRQRQQEFWGSKGLAGEDPSSWVTCAKDMDFEPSMQYGELDGGRDIMPDYNHPKATDGAPVWVLEDEQDIAVYAAPMSHSVPCVGYVVKEHNRPGRLRNELVEPIVRRNVDALRDAGFKVPMKAMAVIKNMPEGSSFTFPDGTVVSQEEAVEPERIGRKVVICGDTSDSRAIAGLAEGADVLVHEATNTYLQGIDRGTNITAVTKDAIVHGHSTPHTAGEFAKQIGAKRLILNHFSARYKGDQSAESISLATRIEQQAMETSGLGEEAVAAAWDFMKLSIKPNE